MNQRRTSIEVEGFHHGANPIPAASRIGGMIATGGIHGMDLATGTIPEDPERQAANAFANLLRILDVAGAGPEDVLKVTVFLKDPSLRDAINRAWVRMFPDPHSRPARHTLMQPALAAPQLLQLEVWAVGRTG